MAASKETTTRSIIQEILQILCSLHSYKSVTLFITKNSSMTFDPLPIYIQLLVKSIKLHPIFHIFYRSLAAGTPAISFPREYPLSNTILHVLAISEDRNITLANAFCIFE